MARPAADEDGTVTTGLFVAAIGAAGSLALNLYAGRHAPLLLRVIFGLWVPSPFLLLILLWRFASRWAASMRTTLTALTMLITAGTLAIYVNDLIHPRQAQAAAVYVIVAPVSVLLIAAGLAVTRLATRRSASNGELR